MLLYINILVNILLLLLLSFSVESDSLPPHGPKHARLPWPWLSPRNCWNSCPLSWWCHPTITSSVSLSLPVFSLPQHQSLFQCTICGLGQMCNYGSIIHNSCPPCSSAPTPSPWRASMFLLSAWFCIFQRVTELNHAVCSLIRSILSRVSVCVV